MKYLIYYIEDDEELNSSEVEHLREEGNEEAIQNCLANRWSAFIPMIPTSGEGPTKLEARQSVIRAAYDAVAAYLQRGQLKAEDFNTLTFEDAPETLTLEELSKMGPRFQRASEGVAA